MCSALEVPGDAEFYPKKRDLTGGGWALQDHTTGWVGFFAPDLLNLRINRKIVMPSTLQVQLQARNP